MSAAAERALQKLTKAEVSALRTVLRRELAAEPKKPKAKQSYEPPEKVAAATRMIRSVSREASGNVEVLPLIAEHARTVDEALRAAVAAARSGEGMPGGQGWSWVDVGRVLGCSKQAAQQRFGRTTT